MSSPFSAVKPSAKLSDQVASALEAEIRAGRIQAAQKLPNEARRTDFADAVTHEHTHIVRAIEAGDPVAARAAAAQHMKNALARIEQADLSFWAQDGARLAQPLVAASAPLVF